MVYDPAHPRTFIVFAKTGSARVVCGHHEDALDCAARPPSQTTQSRRRRHLNSFINNKFPLSVPARAKQISVFYPPCLPGSFIRLPIYLGPVRQNRRLFNLRTHHTKLRVRNLYEIMHLVFNFDLANTRFNSAGGGREPFGIIGEKTADTALQKCTERCDIVRCPNQDRNVDVWR